MILNLSAFNLNTFYDDNLRDVAESTHEMGLACQEIELFLQLQVDSHVQSVWLGTLGSFQRILNRLGEAETSHKNCLVKLREFSVDERRLSAANLRLAHVFQWQKRFGESTSLFLSTLEQIKSLDDEILLSFAYQHLGKNYFDQKLYPAAMECFEKALQIRKRIQNSDLIESSKFAWNKTASRISENN